MKPVAPSKARLRHFVKLHQKKYRDSEGLFLAEGLRTVRELCLHLPDEDMLVALLIKDGEAESACIAEPYGGKVFVVTEKECAQLAATSTSQGVFGVFRQQPPERYESEGKPGQSLIIALDDVQDPGNVGTILRTAVWFGADAMICSAGTVDRYNPKVVRSCAGSLFTLRHYGVEQLHKELHRLQTIGYSLVCSSLDGKDFRHLAPWPNKIVLVIGNEANGISEAITARADFLVRIPHCGEKTGVESLNASVSAAILLERLTLG